MIRSGARSCCLAEVRNVSFDRVEAVTLGAVRVVVADVREHRIAGPAEGREVGGLRHVVGCSRPMPGSTRPR